jgi:Rrf2 family protein
LKLTKSCEYAMRIVIHLGGDDRVITNSELSKRLSIPYHNLTKLIQQLSKAGIIRSLKGKNGGNRLRADWVKLSLKDIVEVIDGPTELSQCIQNDSFCDLTKDCKLKHSFSEIQIKINSLLDDVKLNSLV